MLNIIADVAGQFNALQRLLAIMPKDPFLCVGDLIDRGPQSREVVEFVMKNGRSLLGNHEQMLLDYISEGGVYPPYCWTNNGGYATMESYGAGNGHFFRQVFPKEHLSWIVNLPLYFRTEDLIVTHAPIAHYHPMWENALSDDKLFEYGGFVTWCRARPKKRDFFQVFGHNSSWGLCFFQGLTRIPKFSARAPQDAWAVCIDGSASKVLTGIHWPSKEVFQVPYKE